MTSKEKAEKYIADGKVFPISRTDKFEYWGIDGITGVWEVKYDILKNRYSCNCKNIRSTPCCHIKSIILKKEEKNDR